MNKYFSNTEELNMHLYYITINSVPFYLTEESEFNAREVAKLIYTTENKNKPIKSITCEEVISDFYSHFWKVTWVEGAIERTYTIIDWCGIQAQKQAWKRFYAEISKEKRISEKCRARCTECVEIRKV